MSASPTGARVAPPRLPAGGERASGSGEVLAVGTQQGSSGAVGVGDAFPIDDVSSGEEEATLYDPRAQAQPEAPSRSDVEIEELGLLSRLLGAENGSPVRAVAFAVACFFVGSWFWLLASAILKGAAVFALPFGWILGNAVAIGMGRPGLKTAQLGLVVGAVGLLVGGFFVDRLTQPGLADPLAGIHPREAAMYLAEGYIPEGRHRRVLGVSKEQWEQYTSKERRQLSEPVLSELESRLMGESAPPRLTVLQFASRRLALPLVFVLYGLGLAVAWRAGLGLDASSVFWLRRELRF